MNSLLMLAAVLPGLAVPQTVSLVPPPAAIVPPVLVAQPDGCLTYAPEALQDSHQDKTLLAYLVSADGDVAEVMVTGSSGNANLDEAAVSCVRKWRFKPASQNGEAVNSIGTVAIDWPKQK